MDRLIGTKFESSHLHNVSLVKSSHQKGLLEFESSPIYQKMLLESSHCLEFFHLR